MGGAFKMIPVFKPFSGPEELKALKEVLSSGWWGLGPKTKEFEDEFARYLGSKYAVGLSSCTAALDLAFRCIGIEGKEVITTPMTFVSTNHAILYNKGIPVFCDIEQDTLNIDPEKIEGLITKKTKAVVVVHYGGRACSMDKIMAIAKKHGLYVVEDCAHAAGGEYKGKKLGSIGDFGCFSFHVVKNLATGDGGMLVTDNKRWHKRLLRLRWLGITRDTFARNKKQQYAWFYDVTELGYKYHMNDLAAALGLAQLGRLRWANRRREKCSRRYSEQLEGVGDIKYPKSQREANFLIITMSFKLNTVMRCTNT